MVWASVKKHFNCSFYYVIWLFYFTISLSLIYTVNQFYVFPVICYIKTRCNVKYLSYLKKAGLASRNIVHRQKKHSTLCRFILHIVYFRWLEILGLVGNFELKTFSQGGEVWIEIEILSQGFGSSPLPPSPQPTAITLIAALLRIKPSEYDWFQIYTKISLHLTNRPYKYYAKAHPSWNNYSNAILILK